LIAAILHYQELLQISRMSLECGILQTKITKKLVINAKSQDFAECPQVAPKNQKLMWGWVGRVDFEALGEKIVKKSAKGVEIGVGTV